MSDNLSYSIRKKKDVSILDLYGKIIGSRAFTLKEELLRLKNAGISKVVLNFEGVTSIDSLGIMSIGAALREGLSIKAIYVNSHCRQLLEQNSTTREISILGTEDAATEALSGSHLDYKEMRKHKRITTNIPVEIMINDTRHRGILMNISEGGALVGHLDPFVQESYKVNKINITMELPLLGAIELDGRPIRYGRTGEMHIIGLTLFYTEKNKKLINQVSSKTTVSSDQPFT